MFFMDWYRNLIAMIKSRFIILTLQSSNSVKNLPYDHVVESDQIP